MIRTWKTLALAALVAAVFPLTAVAGGGSGSTDKDVGKKLDELRGAITALTKKVDGLQSAATADKASLDEIRQRLGALEKALQTMQPPAFTDRSRSFYPPPGAGAAVGRVLLRNDYAADVTLTLNNSTTFRVPAFQTREIGDVPAGPLTYQVFVDGWGPGAVIGTTLAPNKTVSLVVK